MKHDSIDFDLKNEPSLKLLRSDNAPLIISFLYRQFKHANRLTIPESELVEKLENYLETLREQQPELYPGKAQMYLETWCNNEHQFLKKYYETNDDPVFELTAGTSRAIVWLEDLERKGFVGTESQFLEIFALLEEIVTKSTVDPGVRLAQLEKQKAAIEKEIDTIKQTGEVERYSEDKLKEWFLKANDAARRLLADFGAVEENFKDITIKVQEVQLKEEVRKGLVLEDVFNADEKLRKSAQGRSFYAFQQFLTAPSKQEELETLLEEIYNLPELQELAKENPILRGIKRSLIKASYKIVQSNRRLAEQLRKMLDEPSIAENRRVMELIADIKKLARVVMDNPPAKEDFISIEGYPEVQLVMERPLWKPTEESSFNSYTLNADREDLLSENMEALYSQFYVDEEVLKQRIATMLAIRDRVTLAQVTERYPVEKGISEVIAYLAIASQDEKHQIDGSVREPMTIPSYPDNENIMRLTMPQVVFTR